jgi:hypothetical protein
MKSKLQTIAGVIALGALIAVEQFNRVLAERLHVPELAPGVGGPIDASAGSELASYGVVVEGTVEKIRWSLYDSLTYAGAGQVQLIFFQAQKGALGSVGVAAGNKTLQDTDMIQAGSLPSYQNFLAEGIELYVFPGSANAAVYTPSVLITTGAALTGFANDLYTFAQSGWLDFFISSKSYLDEAPLLKFPPKAAMHAVFAASDSTTPAAAKLTIAQYASLGGYPYLLNPPILLTPSQNFNVNLNWNVALALPSGFAAKVVCSIPGFLYRVAQ